MTKHLGFRQGKRIYVQLKDGTAFVAKFKETVRRWMYFLDHDRVAEKDIRSATIYRARPDATEVH